MLKESAMSLLVPAALVALLVWTFRVTAVDGYRRRPAHKYYDTRQPA